MPRLTILIPFAGDVESFESTLASVLQNRPERCEVLVVHAGPYGDPYHLAGDVQFIEQAAKSSVVQLLNAGLEVAAGEFVHVLKAGAEVDEGWTAAALECFAAPQVGMVSPLLFDGTDANQVIAYGVKYSLGGKRKLAGAGARVSRRTPRKVHVLGPTLAAGFYRTEALLAVGGFDAAMGDELADVDVALTLQALGCNCMYSAECAVRFTNPASSRHATFRYGRSAERLFWRHRPRHGGAWAFAIHPFTVLTATVAEFPRWSAFTQLLGRSAACLEFGSVKRFEKELQEAIAVFNADAIDTLPMTSKAKPQPSQTSALRRAA